MTLNICQESLHALVSVLCDVTHLVVTDAKCDVYRLPLFANRVTSQLYLALAAMYGVPMLPFVHKRESFPHLRFHTLMQVRGHLGVLGCTFPELPVKDNVGFGLLGPQ